MQVNYIYQYCDITALSHAGVPMLHALKTSILILSAQFYAQLYMGRLFQQALIISVHGLVIIPLGSTGG